MMTFHPFPRLALELRIQIWALKIEDRVIKIMPTKARNPPYHWSPTPAPAITRVCRESREHCSYQNIRLVTDFPQYIWINYDYDTIHVRSMTIGNPYVLPMHEVKHVRVEVMDDFGCDNPEEEWYYGGYNGLRKYHKLENVDLLVFRPLNSYVQWFEDFYFGCPRSNVKIISLQTGEWIDSQTSPAYADYIDSHGGEDLDSMTRIPDETYAETETMEERIEGMKKLQMPRPRIDLSYQ